MRTVAELAKQDGAPHLNLAIVHSESDAMQCANDLTCMRQQRAYESAVVQRCGKLGAAPALSAPGSFLIVPHETRTSNSSAEAAPQRSLFEPLVADPGIRVGRLQRSARAYHHSCPHGSYRSRRKDVT